MAEEPDWEGFGRAVMASWPDGDLDGYELQELAAKHNVLSEVEGGYNPEIHGTDHWFDPVIGDPWFVKNFAARDTGKRE